VQENGAWKKGHNLQLYKLFNEPDIIKSIKVKKRERAGHLIRASENRMIKKVFNIKPYGTRRVGRTRWAEILCGRTSEFGA
jgi:hypothetical protein